MWSYEPKRKAPEVPQARPLVSGQDHVLLRSGDLAIGPSDHASPSLPGRIRGDRLGSP